jgi:N-acetylglutamate synthase-like GNAT family acetyltransferase
MIASSKPCRYALRPTAGYGSRFFTKIHHGSTLARIQFFQPIKQMNWELLSNYLVGFREFYPEIETWIRKVREELPSRRRSVWTVVDGDRIVGAAITKNEEHVKLCHFSIYEDTRLHGVGRELMWIAMSSMVMTGARTVHVTTCEETAETFGGFFKNCGFSVVSWTRGRYRPGVDEYRWLATRETLVQWLNDSYHCRATAGYGSRFLSFMDNLRYDRNDDIC